MREYLQCDNVKNNSCSPQIVYLRGIIVLSVTVHLRNCEERGSEQLLLSDDLTREELLDDRNKSR